jgi:hypothetical protein
MKILPSLFFLFFAGVYIASGQTSSGGDNEGYTVVRNDPENNPKFSIIAYPFLGQTRGYGSAAACYGIDLEYNIIPNFSITGSFFRSYGKGTLADTKDAIDLKPYQDINAGAIIYLTNKKINSLHHVSAWYKKGFRIKPYYVKNVPLENVVKFGFEGGWNSSNSIITGKLGNLKGYEVSDPAKMPYNLNAAGNVSNLSTTSFFVGINSTTLTDYLVKFDNIEMEDEDLSGEYQFYMDLLFPLSASFSNVKVTDAHEAPVGIYDLNSNTPKNRVGFRTGLKLTVAKNPGITWGIELGSQPCVPKNAFYMMFKIGLGIHV